MTCIQDETPSQPPTSAAMENCCLGGVWLANCACVSKGKFGSHQVVKSPNGQLKSKSSSPERSISKRCRHNCTTLLSCAIHSCTHHYQPVSNTYSSHIFDTKRTYSTKNQQRPPQRPCALKGPDYAFQMNVALHTPTQQLAKVHFITSRSYAPSLSLSPILL